MTDISHATCTELASRLDRIGEYEVAHLEGYSLWPFSDMILALRAALTDAEITIDNLTAANAALAADNARLGKRVDDARDALDNLSSAIMATDQFNDRSLTIAGPTGNLKWLIEAEHDARAWLAGGDA